VLDDRDKLLLKSCFAIGVLWTLISLLCGCDKPLPKLQYLADRQQPIPVAHLPVDYRLKNWIGQNDRGAKGGSCFWASVYMCVRQADRPDIEDLLIQNRGKGFEGPEHLQSMCRKLASIGIPWAATEDGDIELLQRASDNRRWAAIGYYPGHAICFCGFYDSSQGELAILLDNNFPDDYIGVPRRLFEESWIHAYGGMAIVPWLEPAILNSYPRTRILSYDPHKTPTVCSIAARSTIDDFIRHRSIELIRDGWLGQRSGWPSLVTAGTGRLRAFDRLSPRSDHRTEVVAYQAAKYSSNACGDTGTDLSTDLPAHPGLPTGTPACTYSKCAALSELSIPNQSILFAAIERSLRRRTLWQYDWPELWIPVVRCQLAAATPRQLLTHQVARIG
jgi:hypothetical protein